MKKKCIILFSPMLFVFLFSMAQNQTPPPSQEERLKQVSEKIIKEIKLSAAQKTKIETAYKDFFVDVENLRSKNGMKEMPPPPPPPPGSKKEMDKLIKARDAKIKSALTETQYTKYVEMEASLRPHRPDDIQPPPLVNKIPVRIIGNLYMIIPFYLRVAVVVYHPAC